MDWIECDFWEWLVFLWWKWLASVWRFEITTPTHTCEPPRILQLISSCERGDFSGFVFAYAQLLGQFLRYTRGWEDGSVQVKGNDDVLLLRCHDCYLVRAYWCSGLSMFRCDKRWLWILKTSSFNVWWRSVNRGSGVNWGKKRDVCGVISFHPFRYDIAFSQSHVWASVAFVSLALL